MNFAKKLDVLFRVNTIPPGIFARLQLRKFLFPKSNERRIDIKHIGNFAYGEIDLLDLMRFG
jgi:hypothetical protein